MPEQAQYRQRGFSLLELLLAMVIIGVVAAATVTLVNSVRHSAKAGETKQRMEIVAAKMQEYYRHQGNLPTPDGATLAADATLTGRVPVTALNLETRHAYDAWGQPFGYIIRTRATTDTDIAAITVDHIDNMAGVLISGGGNQTQESATWDSPNLVAASTGDDLVLAINVNREAMEVALNEVRELQRRVQQFDNLFTGSDHCRYVTNNYTNENIYSPPTTIFECPPVNPSSYGGNNPNCGTASLDLMAATNTPGADSYGCQSYVDPLATGSPNGTPLEVLVKYYGLSEQYLTDPWGNPYQWGCSDNTETGASGVCDSGSDSPVRFFRSDKQYRKFFSMGPSGCTGSVNVGSQWCWDSSTDSIVETSYDAADSFEDDDMIP